MELKDHIEPTLWNRIKKKYDNSQYSDAIKSSIYYLNKLIQDRSYLSTDNTDLVNRAFKIKEPIIKITKNKTQVEKDIQDGFRHLLLGVFKSFRNPIAHEEMKYSKEDTISIILFIDYLCSILNKSETRFNEQQFLKRLSDNAYVATKKYSQLLVDEIPKKKLFDIAIYILRNRTKYNLKNISSFNKQLMKVLDQKSLTEIYQNVSDELRNADRDIQIESIFAMYEFNEFWEKISEISKLRTENYLLSSLRNGSMDYHRNSYNRYEEDIDIDLGLLAKKILPGLISHLSNKNEIFRELHKKLISSDPDLFDYVDSIFFEDIIDIGMQFSSQNFIFSGILAKKAKSKDDQFALLFLQKLENHPNKDSISEFYNDYIEKFREIKKEYNEFVPF